MFYWEYSHTAWILIRMSKRPGATSGNDVILKKINEDLNIKEKKILWAILEGCNNRAWPI